MFRFPLPRPSGLPTHPQRPGDVPLDPKREGRSGRLAEKALYCALEENAHRFFRAPAARRSDFVCAPFGRACLHPGRLNLQKVHLTSKFSFTHGRKLGSPRGGTNSDRVQRTKQGAVSGAALRFLQAPAMARRKNRLSARGAGETPARAARLRGQQKSARLRGRLEGLYRFCKNVCRGRPALAVSTFPAAFGPGRPDGPAPRRGR